MKKVYTLLLFCFLIAGLCFPVFADILPPSYYRVTPEKPITRYTLEKYEDGSETLVEAGKASPERTIDVIKVVTIDGEKYGVYQERVYENPDHSGSVWKPSWEYYYFLMEDVFSPEEMATAEDKPHPWEVEASKIESFKAERSKRYTEETSQLPETAADEAEMQSRAAMPILPVCIVAAVILTLTAVVTLLLIRRRRNNIQNETRKEGE